MQQLLKITQILIFTILLLVIGVFIWQFFNPFAQILFFPLLFLSVYYLLLHVFAKLNAQKTSKIWLYLGIVLIALPLIAYVTNYRSVMEFSLNILTSFKN